MHPSSIRVAERHLKIAMQEWPVPLSREQRGALQKMLRAVIRDFKPRDDNDLGKLSYSARTDYQTSKVYRRDGFGRKSVLAGKPHAAIKIFGGFDPWEFLLSEDGEVAVLKEDTPWGRVTRPVSVEELGNLWSKALESDRRRRDDYDHRVQMAEKRKEEAQREREEEAKRKEEEAKRKEEARRLKQQRDLELQGGGGGYKLVEVVDWENDESDVDVDPWDGKGDPDTGTATDTVKRQALEDVWRYFGSSMQGEYNYVYLYRDKIVLNRETSSNYASRGTYGLNRLADETTTVRREDGKPFTATEREYIEKYMFPFGKRTAIK